MSAFCGTTDELLAVLNSEDLEKYLNEKARRKALENEAEKYRKLDPAQWPKLQFNWSLDRASLHESFDGWEAKEISKHYPVGLLIGWVKLQVFDEQLCLYNKRRNIDELWSCGSESKLAYMLAYLSHSNPISPVVVGIATDGQVCLHGGSHRYTAAKFSRETKFPFLCNVKDKTHLIASYPFLGCKMMPNISFKADGFAAV